MLYYLPLESYVERYTYFMSCPDGWTESWFKKFNVPFVRIDGEQKETTIKVGSVLDAFGRCQFAMSQIDKMIDKIRNGEVKDGDVIYVEDFWHPGVESLFYIRDLTGIKFKVGCFIHAQSIDDSDFTYSMKNWIRDIEIGLSKGYDYVFTCSDILKDIAIKAGFNPDHIYKFGLPYNSSKLLDQLSAKGFEPKEKENFVLFSSRFDKEKNPSFFLDLVEACPDIQFKLVKPRKHLTNDAGILKRLEENNYPNLEIVDTSDKLSYYDLLSRAKVQFNCAYQDWVSWTLLEAITFNCLPLYPDHKDFPFELKGFENDHIYKMNNLAECKERLYNLMDKGIFNEGLKEIPARHDQSWKNYLKTMGLL